MRENRIAEIHNKYLFLNIFTSVVTQKNIGVFIFEIVSFIPVLYLQNLVVFGWLDGDCYQATAT